MTSLGFRCAAAIVIAAALGACAPSDPNAPRKLTDDVSVSGQIAVANVKALKDKGFKTIVNMRPDDESPDQSKYQQLQKAAQDAGLGYGYIPVKQGAAIPGTAAEALNTVLRRMPKPVLVFSDTAATPARTWALAEASRAGGLDAAQILADVKSSGQSADDLGKQIDARIAARPKH